MSPSPGTFVSPYYRRRGLSRLGPGGEGRRRPTVRRQRVSAGATLNTSVDAMTDGSARTDRNGSATWISKETRRKGRHDREQPGKETNGGCGRRRLRRYRRGQGARRHERRRTRRAEGRLHAQHRRSSGAGGSIL